VPFETGGRTRLLLLSTRRALGFKPWRLPGACLTGNCFQRSASRLLPLPAISLRSGGFSRLDFSQDSSAVAEKTSGGVSAFRALPLRRTKVAARATGGLLPRERRKAVVLGHMVWSVA